MQGTIRWVVIAGLLSACHTDDTNPPDVPPGSSGLVVRWSSAPTTWPGDLGNGVTIDSARFKMDSLRVIGDAGPGDPRTSATAYEARWDEGTKPADNVFADAPPGLYSQISISIDGHLTEASYELRGHVFVSSQQYEYRIEDQNALTFTVQTDKMLAPGGEATIGLRVNFIHAIDVVNFAALPVEEGRLELESGNAQMPTFRANLVESFEIVNADR